MDMAVRSFFTAGVTAVAASAIAIAPSVAPPPTPRASTIQLAAQSRPLLDQFDRISTLLANGKAIAVVPAGAAPGVGAAAAPAPQNAASDFVTSAWNFADYWITYGVDVADYALGFIPGLGFIGDQINIVYDVLISPIGDSVVYGLIDPVLNNPLNPAVWVNGLVIVGSTTVAALVNTGVAEFNYFFGWLIPPLPPLPFPPLPGLSGFAAQQQTATLAASLATTEQPAETTPAGVLEALGQRLGLHNPVAKDVRNAVATAQGLVSDLATAKVSIPDAVTNATEVLTGAVQQKVPADVATVPDLDPTDAPVLKAVVGAPRKAADGVVAAQGAVKGAVDDVADAVKNERKAVRDAVKATPTTVAKTVRDGVQKAGDGVEKAAGAVAKVRNDVRKAVKAAQSDSEE